MRAPLCSCRPLIVSPPRPLGENSHKKLIFLMFSFFKHNKQLPMTRPTLFCPIRKSTVFVSDKCCMPFEMGEKKNWHFEIQQSSLFSRHLPGMLKTAMQCSGTGTRSRSCAVITMRRISFFAWLQKGNKRYELRKTTNRGERWNSLDAGFGSNQHHRAEGQALVCGVEQKKEKKKVR